MVGRLLEREEWTVLRIFAGSLILSSSLSVCAIKRFDLFAILNGKIISVLVATHGSCAVFRQFRSREPIIPRSPWVFLGGAEMERCSLFISFELESLRFQITISAHVRFFVIQCIYSLLTGFSNYPFYLDDHRSVMRRKFCTKIRVVCICYVSKPSQLSQKPEFRECFFFS